MAWHKITQNKQRLTAAGFAVLVLAAAGSCYSYSQHQSSGISEASRIATAGSTAAAKAQANGLAAADAGNKLSPASPPPAVVMQSTATWPAAPAAPMMAANSLALASSSNQLSPGDNLTLTLYENSGAVGVNAVQARLTYDAAALEFVGTVVAPDFGLEAATDTTTPGLIRLARAVQDAAPIGTHPVLTLHFSVKQAAAGEQAVLLDAGSSYIVRASDSANILQTVTAAHLTIQRR